MSQCLGLWHQPVRRWHFNIRVIAYCQCTLSQASLFPGGLTNGTSPWTQQKLFLWLSGHKTCLPVYCRSELTINQSNSETHIVTWVSRSREPFDGRNTLTASSTILLVSLVPCDGFAEHLPRQCYLTFSQPAFDRLLITPTSSGVAFQNLIVLVWSAANAVRLVSLLPIALLQKFRVISFAGLWTLETRRNAGLAFFVKRLLTNRLPQHLRDVMNAWLSSPPILRRSVRQERFILALPKQKKEFLRRSPLYILFCFWNKVMVDFCWSKKICLLFLRDPKTHSLKLQQVTSVVHIFLTFSCPSLQESTGQIMLKLNKTRSFMHVRQPERHKKQMLTWEKRGDS